MRHDLLSYRVFYCALTPSFILLDASAKSRCLGKLSLPPSLSRQVKTVILSQKLVPLQWRDVFWLRNILLHQWKTNMFDYVSNPEQQL